MGNIISTPESMKQVPNKLNKDEYLQMTYNGTVYCIQKRSLGNQINGSIKQGFSAESFAMDALGLGAFRNMNKTKTGRFYVTKDNPLNEPLPTTADSSELKWFIKAFAFEKGIKLENATFELKNLTKQEQKQEQKEIKQEQKAQSFGKRKAKKVSKELKRLRMDLKKVRSF